MINEDLRHIVEPELAEGEELLWAEKTIVSAQQEIVQIHEDDTELSILFAKFLLWLGIPILIGFIIFFPSIRMISIILLFGLPIAVVSIGLASADNVEAVENMAIGGYALTNLRLFELDTSLKVTRRDDASKLRKVSEEVGCIIVKPVGSGILKVRNLSFLSNNYVTTNYIRSLIENASGKGA